MAAIWLSEATRVHHRNGGVTGGSLPAPAIAIQTTTSHSAANGRPYRNRTSVAPSAPRSPVRCRCAALRSVCASAAPIVIGIQAQETSATYLGCVNRVCPDKTAGASGSYGAASDCNSASVNPIAARNASRTSGGCPVWKM